MEGGHERTREVLGVQRLAAGRGSDPRSGRKPHPSRSGRPQARPSPCPPLPPQTCPLRSPHTGPSAATPPRRPGLLVSSALETTHVQVLQDQAQTAPPHIPASGSRAPWGRLSGGLYQPCPVRTFNCSSQGTSIS